MGSGSIRETRDRRRAAAARPGARIGAAIARDRGLDPAIAGGMRGGRRWGGARGETAREGARGGRAARRAFARAASGTRRPRRAGGSWTGAHLGRGVLRGLVLRQALILQHVHQGGLAGVVETLETRGGDAREGSARVRGEKFPASQDPAAKRRKMGRRAASRRPRRGGEAHQEEDLGVLLPQAERGENVVEPVHEEGRHLRRRIACAAAPSPGALVELARWRGPASSRLAISRSSRQGQTRE